MKKRTIRYVLAIFFTLFSIVMVAIAPETAACGIFHSPNDCYSYWSVLVVILGIASGIVALILILPKNHKSVNKYGPENLGTEQDFNDAA